MSDNTHKFPTLAAEYPAGSRHILKSVSDGLEYEVIGFWCFNVILRPMAAEYQHDLLIYTGPEMEDSFVPSNRPDSGQRCEFFGHEAAVASAAVETYRKVMTTHVTRTINKEGM